jgi:cytochrome c
MAMKRIGPLFIILFIVGIFQAFVVIRQNNNTPVVHIITPFAKDAFKWDAQTAYSISVEDKEDGLSKYEEITESEVFLKIKFLPDSQHRVAYEKEQIEENSVFTSLKKNACFNCHGIHSKIAAPTYESIALKYQKTPDVFKKLGSKIIQGSKGVWGDSQMMPSHPDLSANESTEMAKWIIKHGPDMDFDIRVGLKGMFKTRKASHAETQGQYSLIASYLDHGINGKDFKEGKHVVVLNSASK